MIQIAIPDGFDLIYFSWDRLAPMASRAAALSQVGLAPASGAHPTAAPRAVERMTAEEDVERWDGLS
jgi:hypothetical protein